MAEIENSQPVETPDELGLGICTVYSIGICLEDSALSDETGSASGVTPLLASIWYGLIAVM